MSAFEKLQRILELEAQKKYQNDAIVGGLQKFAIIWAGQAQDETAGNDRDNFLIEQIAQELSNYHRLPGVEARGRVVNNVIRNLKARKSAAPMPSKPLKQAIQPTATTPSAQATQPAKKHTSPPSNKPAKSKPKPKPRSKSKPRSPSKNTDDLLDQSVQYLKGVGPKIAELLNKLGIETVRDLLTHYPRRYDDYTQMKAIRELEYGEVVTVIGTVWAVRTRKTRTNQTSVHAVIGDGTAKVQLTFFNQPWLVDKIKSGSQIVVSGRVDQYLGRLTFTNPEWEPVLEDQLAAGKIVPIYPLTKGLGANRMRMIVQTAVDQSAKQLVDPLPNTIRQRQKLLKLSNAIKQVHFPADQKQLHNARRRLMFDEMFLLQLGMLGQRHSWEKQPAHALKASEAARIRLYNTLPFELTRAQKRAIRDIVADMMRPTPMNRLLQGDVGSGKTLVAAAAIIHAIKSGVQVALMAPTAILAEQHYRGLAKLLEPMGVVARLLIGSTKTADKAQINTEIATGQANLLIGTTALIQPNVTFKHLGLIVIDEQHRFGVDQRGALRDKGITDYHPHLLVMTATPIPRSLALSLYGDLELSIIDEMPPGRQEILTRWLRSTERRRAYDFIRKQAAEGRQTYVIYPLVEESEKLDDVKAAVEEHERLQREEFPNLRVGLLHGRMKGAEKEAVMRQFYAHELDVLVSTTVIEVGIDVPNATIIVIEAANRFGLAQLHQLRGRVGRGKHASYCILIADSQSEQAEERLKALVDTNDGFQLAEKDLELRGPGEFFGRRQSGLPELKLASLLDPALLKVTQAEARGVYKMDPNLSRPEHHLLKENVAHFWENAGDVS